MTDQKYHLRAGDAGPEVQGTAGHVLTFQSDGTVAGEAPATSDPGGVRADWAFKTSMIFTATEGGGNVQADGVATFVDVAEGDTIFFPPSTVLAPPFHSGPAAPQFGGLYVVFSKTDDTHIAVTRDPRMATSAQIAAVAVVAVDAGDAAGVYQVQTPPDAVINVDPQVMPMIGIAPSLNNGDLLSTAGNFLAWVAPA